VVGAGAGAATTARRWCWRGYPFLVKGAPDVCAKASAGVRVSGKVIDTGLARHGVVTNGAAAFRPAPWVAADTAAAARLKRAWRRRSVTKRALAGQEGGACSSASACARQPATARPWRRGRGGVRTGGPAQGKGPKARPSLQGYGARVLGCTPARGRRGPHGRARMRTRRDANAPSRRDDDQDGAASYG
jgi:hypothetical protein